MREWSFTVSLRKLLSFSEENTQLWPCHFMGLNTVTDFIWVLMGLPCIAFTALTTDEHNRNIYNTR